MIGSAILALAMQAQPGPATAGSFSPAEIRTMCRGETEGPSPFRTEAAIRLLAEHQRSKCRMYLLGLAEGLARSGEGRDPPLCLPPRAERDGFADRLLDAVLSETGDDEAALPNIVRRVILTHYRCP